MRNVGNEFAKEVDCNKLFVEMRTAAQRAASTKLTKDYRFWEEDIVQDVLYKIYQNFDKYDVEKGNVCAWVYRITINACVDLMRNKSIKNTIRINDINYIESYIDYTNSVDCEEIYLQLEQSIKELSELEESLIKLKYYEGKSSREISHILNIPENQVPVFMQRTRKKIEKSFATYKCAA